MTARRFFFLLTSSLLHTLFFRFFEDQAKAEPAKYLKFFGEFGHFLKEGVCSDQQHQVR
jgi:HSP90 family molecular chaperone